MHVSVQKPVLFLTCSVINNRLFFVFLPWAVSKSWRKEVKRIYEENETQKRTREIREVNIWCLSNTHAGLSSARIARTGTRGPKSMKLSILSPFVLCSRQGKNHKSREGFLQCCCWRCNLLLLLLLIASLSEKLFINPQEAFVKIASVEINRMEWRD